MRFRLSTLILAVTLFAIVWAMSTLPWVQTEELTSFIEPGRLIVIHETMRPPTPGEIAVRTIIGAVLVFGGWAGIRYWLRKREFQV